MINVNLKRTNHPSYNLELICYGVLVTGVIILIVGAIGWYAGFTSNIKVCRVYCVLIVIIVILQAVFAIVGNDLDEIYCFVEITCI